MFSGLQILTYAILIVLGIGLIIFLPALITKFLIKEIKYKKCLQIIMLSIVVNIVVSLLLSIGLGGFFSEIIVILISYIVGLLGSAYIIKRYTSFSFLKSFGVQLLQVILSFICVVIILLIIRITIANPFTVVGQAMGTTLNENDFVFVEKITPRSHYKRGDIIVFFPPNKNTAYLKRVVGLPGEKLKFKNNQVEICKGGNCETLIESYLPTDSDPYSNCGKSEFELRDGYFVMGDNRGHTTDSLCCFELNCDQWGPYEIAGDMIIGRVFLRLTPDFKIF